MNRDFLRIWVLFTLLGLVGSILPANIYYLDPRCFHVDLEKSLSWATLGGLGGTCLGVVVGAVCQEKPRARAWVLFLATVLLAIGIGAASGWEVGGEEAGATRPQGPLTRLGLASGGLIGLFLGVFCGMGHMLWQRRQRAAMPDPGAMRGLLAGIITGANFGAIIGLGWGAFYASVYLLFFLVEVWWAPELHDSSISAIRSRWLWQLGNSLKWSAGMCLVSLIFFTAWGILVGLLRGTFQALQDTFFKRPGNGS